MGAGYGVVLGGGRKRERVREGGREREKGGGGRGGRARYGECV